ncbi:MAG: hypothetical protein QHH06_04685, partial [Clostridiales bacterium]|nr:hypothetical protein [Clostridiales bacterium]
RTRDRVFKKNCIFRPEGYGMMNIPASSKYAVIQEMTQRDNNLLNITWLCAAAGVSRSGYYHYLETEDLRRQREEQDQKDFLIILEAYQFRGYDKGARGIYMRLLHMDSPVHMNIKKIRRLMKKYRFCSGNRAPTHRELWYLFDSRNPD